MEPKISVLMGIYNCADTLSESLDSLLNQTYQNFVIIMCDDGSKDNTYEVARNYVDRYPEKFILLKNEKNMGLTYTLNKCLDKAETKYVARQDGDDISYPDRFQKEYDFLEIHSEYSFVSCAMDYADEQGIWNTGTVINEPEMKNFIFGSPFCHAPSMTRTEVLKSINGYRDIDNTRGVEDYDLWFRLYAAGYRGYNLSEALYQMFDGRDAQSRRTFKRRQNEAWVMYNGFKDCKVNPLFRLFALKPIIVGLLPNKIYKILRKTH